MENTKTFDIGLEEAEESAVNLTDQLLVLRLALGKLRVAISDAAAPFAAVLVPALNKAVFWAIRAVRAVGKVMGALLGVRVTTESVEKSTVRAGKAIKRSLASFDQLNRLEGNSGGSSVVSQTVPRTVNDTLSPQLAAIVEKIRGILAPLQQIDFAPLMERLQVLGGVFEVLAQRIGTALGWVWNTLLTPLMAWIIEQFAPALLGALSSALKAVITALTPVGEGFATLWQAMQPVVSFIGEVVIGVLGLLQQAFDKVTMVLLEKSGTIRQTFADLGVAVSGLWATIGPMLSQIWQQFKLTFDQISTIAAGVVGYLIGAFGGLATFLAGVFSGDWGKAWQGICTMLKNSVNSIIGLLNSLIQGVVGAVNGVVRALNTLKITVPDWVPGFGGKKFSLNLNPAKAPQIPYLAKGAVLPANKPFLAMVGDQKHGTNIEAPLTTIQEAVALVMNDQLSAMMSGFSATVQELRQLRDTVSAIEVGDTVIGAAAQRYNRKMAVVRGGQF